MRTRKWILGVLVGAASCNVPETVDLPVNQPKLVVNLITQDHVHWKAQLSASQGVLQPPPFLSISNGNFRIFENGVLVEQLTFVEDFNDDFYAGLLTSPTPGKNYRLEVSAQSYLTASAEYSHPTVVPVDGLDVSFLGTSETSNSDRMKFKVTFTDPAGKNFYSISIRQKSNDSDFPDAAKAITLYYSNPAFEENKEVFLNSIIFSDADFQANEITIELEANISYYPGEDLKDYPFFTVSLDNLSDGLYEYLKTNSLQALSEGQPFSQPVVVANNIENGFGIFGGSTRAQMTTEYK